ncbi:heme-degrading domain-containing protein [Conyzicola sp.]|uniref:heme-degrading domain-containing protein n=1 Tax=Conyzicola sp. TaxID=1969404 RepID=UPI003989D6D7
MTEDFAAQIAEIEQQEARLQFTRFTHADALELGLLLVRLGTERSLGITIDITKGEQQVFHVSLAGTTADNDDWVDRKTRTVKRYSASSFLVGRRFKLENKDFNASSGLPLSLFAAHGGCFPIVIRDAGMVGTVTVSGLAQADDHALVVEALELFLGQ